MTLEHVPNAAGWGAVDEEATIGTALLQEAWLELQSDQDCEPLSTDPPAQTCAGTLDTAGVCKGDSGGPLLVFDDNTGAPVLWGLTSYGPQIGLDLPVCSLAGAGRVLVGAGLLDVHLQHDHGRPVAVAARASGAEPLAARPVRRSCRLVPTP